MLSAELSVIHRCVFAYQDIRVIHLPNVKLKKWYNTNKRLHAFRALAVSMLFVENRTVLVHANVCQSISEIPTKDVDPNAY